MIINKILTKIITFICIFTIIFFGIRYLNLLPVAKLQENINSVPWLFSTISLIFSIICGFVIQSRWQMWDELIDASRGELSSFRQLNIMAHHFPENIKNIIRKQIAEYLKLTIEEIKSEYSRSSRSNMADFAIYQLEDTFFSSRKDHQDSGLMAFEILRSCINYRDRRLQNNAHKLPMPIKTFIISATVSIIFTSLFIGVDSLLYDYIFTLTIGLLAYGIYLVIDDLDHPYLPGAWHLKTEEYEELRLEVMKKL